MRRACGMFRAQGHEVILYGPDRSDADVDEHVVITTQADRERWGFGDGFNTALTPFSWEISSPHFAEANARAAIAVKERAEDTDLLLLTTSAQAFVAQTNPVLTVAEWTVGYEGIHERDRWFCAFESYAWMHHVYGLKGWRNGRPFDRVIPTFIDHGDYRLAEKRDYLLFVGRLVQRKGAHIAAEIAARAGLPLVIAGPGEYAIIDGRPAVDGITLDGDVEYVGELGRAGRAELMSRARALVMPTIYLEPGGNVAIEAMMSGTPVVASDWGVFTETVTPDVGARFRSLAGAESALEHALSLYPEEIREAAAARYSLTAVGPQFTDWFEALNTLWDQGWYQPRLVAA